MPASHSITSVGGFKAQDEIKVELKPEPLILSLYTNVDRKYSLRHKGLSYENFKVIYNRIQFFYSYTALYIVFSSINAGVFAYDYTSRGASHLGDLLYLFWLLHGKRFDTIGKSVRHHGNI